MIVPFIDLSLRNHSFRKKIQKIFLDVFKKNQFIGGQFVHDFEQSFANEQDAKHAISCGNGTDALFIILKMLGIGAGDEVLLAANACIADGEAVSLTGATPVFVDVDSFYCIDGRLIEEKITVRTKAILAVHLYGQLCDVDRLAEICKKNSLLLVEDCAQSHFSEYKGKKAGMFGIAAAFSFYPTKNLGAYGDAGCMITNDDELAIKLRMYARHGALIKNQHLIEGVNSRMDSLQAAVLLTKLPYIHDWNKQRVANADLYNHLLSEVNEIVLPQTLPETKHTYHLYVIRTKERNKLAEYLRTQGVETAIHYPTALPFLQAYRYLNHTPADFPVADQQQHEILSLPMFPGLTHQQIEYTANCIKDFYSKKK
ncbi:MAG: Aminotransferase, DegT/DnrJ/EryC1/StrS family [Cytophagales bacterium]|jgi:dTDP-4-amino-4,6-dideoxygalactose transaminase|nr:DegT/DnrJ/EryC1/StrS family aminotransferase [Bacteroidota bacterium]MBS1981579.1 DegT/DnrJ/EryC1/StrS family aminotransferase [Bacteroidota bacterium]WHZ08885.1 MAG: Aminotransferase, DegT/DnrJ/EryC1/StrS family [Cytophagales bacterium]